MKKNTRSRTRSRRAKGEPIPWDEIRLAYVTRPDRPTYYRLEQEFGLGRTTVQKKGKTENWKEFRREHHNGVLSDAQKKVGEKQIPDLAKSIEILNGIIERLVWEMDGARAQSLEGLARETRRTIKTLNVYLERPTERNELTEEGMEKLAETLLKIKKKAPEEYAELKEVYGMTSDDGGN
ncbi:MAG: hypothetical protein ABIH66_03350 [bacterium]